MVEKILNNTTPYGKIRASHEGSLHSSTLKQFAFIISLLPGVQTLKQRHSLICHIMHISICIFSQLGNMIDCSGLTSLLNI